MASAATAKIRFTYVGQFQNDPEVSIEKGEIKDGTEVVSGTFRIPQDNVKYDFGLSLIIAIKYETPNAAEADRDDYSVMLDALVQEVLNVIGVIISAAK